DLPAVLFRNFVIVPCAWCGGRASAFPGIQRDTNEPGPQDTFLEADPDAERVEFMKLAACSTNQPKNAIHVIVTASPRPMTKTGHVEASRVLCGAFLSLGIIRSAWGSCGDPVGLLVPTAAAIPATTK